MHTYLQQNSNLAQLMLYLKLFRWRKKSGFARTKQLLSGTETSWTTKTILNRKLAKTMQQKKNGRRNNGKFLWKSCNLEVYASYLL